MHIIELTLYQNKKYKNIILYRRTSLLLSSKIKKHKNIILCCRESLPLSCKEKLIRQMASNIKRIERAKVVFFFFSLNH